MNYEELKNSIGKTIDIVWYRSGLKLLSVAHSSNRAFIQLLVRELTNSEEAKWVIISDLSKVKLSETTTTPEKQMNAVKDTQYKIIPFDHDTWLKYKDKGIIVKYFEDIVGNLTPIKVGYSFQYAGVLDGEVLGFKDDELELDTPIVEQIVPFNFELYGKEGVELVSDFINVSKVVSIQDGLWPLVRVEGGEHPTKYFKISLPPSVLQLKVKLPITEIEQ